ncbi:MAG: tRNA pseudouridine(38-40) synthase TruA [Chloroflexi bacterium]|nr:tRNA pseudouridine(38-40) synthase TruA [Chloroflexota bacterium]
MTRESQATNKIVLIIEYDGTRYLGFQLQADVATVQGEMETALWKLTGKRTRVIAASRTDAGVHARGQVVSFLTESPLPPRTFVSGLNYYLPGDIAVRAAHRVDSSFNVRSDAIRREYSYFILNRRVRSPLKKGFVHHVSNRLDTEAMNEACRALVGEHDFSSFATGMETEIRRPVRTVYRAQVEKHGELAIFNMVANSFLRHQVRNTVGALIRVGLGRMKVAQFCDIIKAKQPGLAGPTAPACGLCLMHVDYEVPFGSEDENV